MISATPTPRHLSSSVARSKCGCYPFTEHATLSMNVAAGTAEEYLEKNLPGVPFELIGR